MNTCKTRLLTTLAIFLSVTACTPNDANISKSDCPPIPLTDNDTANVQLHTQLQQQQLALETLQAKLNDTEQRLQENQQQLADKTQQQLADKTQQLDALTQDKSAQQVATTTSTLTDLEEQLAKQQQEIERLNTALRQAEDAKAAVAPASLPAY